MAALVDKTRIVRELKISADELSGRLLELSNDHTVCILDSCGVSHLGSHLSIAGIDPVAVSSISDRDPENLAKELDRIAESKFPCIFTLSYELGLLLSGIEPRFPHPSEPLIWAAEFAALVVFDHKTQKAFAVGENANAIADLTENTKISNDEGHEAQSSLVSASFTEEKYLAAVERIREEIRSGNTYQTNIVQQFEVSLSGLSAQTIFSRLRRDNPAAFSAFIQRGDSTVVSSSPERFFKVSDGRIEASPIKGTAARTGYADLDKLVREKLSNSRKDRAENTMIVDLLRNDLGRICEFGSVEVTELCRIEEHPTLFHLVSTISGRLRPETRSSDTIKALFPCGSITGAPKISTMKLIDQLEPRPRGLTMGAIGYYIPETFEVAGSGLSPGIDSSVAIRTMNIEHDTAYFAAGGGIVSDSRPELEYAEMLLKAKAIFAALGVLRR